MLHIDSVIKNMGDRQLLTDIYIGVQPGEVVGLLGRNGCGKSTLLQIIFGSAPAERKFVRADGRLIKTVADHKGNMVYLPQQGFIPDPFKVKTAINLYCTRAQAAALKKLPRIAPLVNSRFGNLSGGEKRIVEVLLCLYSRARYVLLDEPFNGVAPVVQEEIMELIKQQLPHKGFIITDHDYENVLHIATQVMLLHNGATKIIKNREMLSQYGYLP